MFTNRRISFEHAPAEVLVVEAEKTPSMTDDKELAEETGHAPAEVKELAEETGHAPAEVEQDKVSLEAVKLRGHRGLSETGNLELKLFSLISVFNFRHRNGDSVHRSALVHSEIQPLFNKAEDLYYFTRPL